MLLGEYLVLHGAKALALPLKFGQKLAVGDLQDIIEWTATSPDGVWFTCKMDKHLNIIDSSNLTVSKRLQSIFRLIQKRNPKVSITRKFNIESNFDLNWGFGSSSTLISALSQWSGIDPYVMLDAAFGGSGYDLACAVADSPITYQITPDGRQVQSVKLAPEVTNHLLFVYHGQKQNTAEDVKDFNTMPIKPHLPSTVSALTERAVTATSIEEFEQLMEDSEEIIGSVLGRETLKNSTFSDYPYSIKSLGAWGGDFFLSTYRNTAEAKSYFQQKGYKTMFTYDEIAL